MQKKPSTIKDVARVAGVSTATVSRALSKPQAVSQATREAVLEAARHTGYQINQAARNLRTRKTRTIVVFVPNLGNPFFSNILSGIEATAAESGMNVLVVDTNSSENRSKSIRNYLSNALADGIIVMDGTLPPELLTAHHPSHPAPPVVFACEWSPAAPFPSVRTDNRGGGFMAAKHLLSLGHSRIGLLRGPRENVLTHERELGLRKGLADAGLELHEKMIFEGDFSIESGATAADAFMSLKDRPTGVFCSSDMMAVGFISALNKYGIQTPGNVSVVAFDDIMIAPHFIPALTTIHQPRERIGVTAASFLIDAIKDAKSQTRRDVVTLPVELIIRDSTAQLS